MQLMVGSRVALTHRPVRRRNPALETAMLGHCPGGVDLERLLDLTDALAEMRANGFGPRLDAVEQGCDADLYHLPIPLYANAEFGDIFPDAHRKETRYESVLAGKKAWLGQAVEDYFANGGEKLWIVRIPQSQAHEGFLPAGGRALHDVASLRGLATVLVIPSVGAVAFPDLERLQVPAHLPDIPRNRLDNPDPRFMPCGMELDDDHRERRYPEEILDAAPPPHIGDLLPRILDLVVRYRPDLVCLFTLPLTYSGSLGRPVADDAALEWINAVRHSGNRQQLRLVQFLFPYLRGPRFRLRSPVGLVTGLQAGVARGAGPWRSMAGHPMVTDALPYPRFSQARMVKLREDPGVGVLQVRNGRVKLDDERLAVPALHPDETAGASDLKRFDGFRSAEVQRLLGYLRRQLQALGETLVFNLDYRDPRPRFALEQFFRRLHAGGALRGALPQDAYRITENHTREGAMIYEIMVAPAFPIDRLYLTFSNLNGAWQASAARAA